MFKKSISVVLSILMVMSCMTTLIVSANSAVEAPAGTKITKLSDITDPDGQYYLDGDIGSADAPNTTRIANFTGTLDGQGYTIYTSVPLFTVIQGATIINLVTRGSIVSDEQYVGVVACQAKTAPVTFENVKNYASITHTTNTNKDHGVGGLVGTMGITGDSFTGCYNYGNFSTAAGAYAPQVHMGGIVGRTDGAATTPVSTTQFVNCYNEGNLRTTIGYSMFGGILGRSSSYEHFKFENCHNKGNISLDTTGNSGRNGGIVGFIQRSGYNLSVIGCSNSGNITATNTVSESQTVIGGIVGDTSSISTFSNCTNTGTLRNNATSDNSLMGGIVGYSRNASANKTYTNCTNEGALYHSGNYTAGIVGYEIGENVNFLNCKNTATASIEVGKDIAPASQTGGISGYTGKGAVYTECTNSGDITAPGLTGGISGKSLGITKIYSCVNEGDISIPADAMDSAYAAGILSNGTAKSYSLYSCVNTGNVSNAKTPDLVAQLAPGIGGAPVGTKITKLSDIKDPNGQYYLDGDIGSADAPNTTRIANFTGTLDGRGYTIYTSVPLFTTLQGATIMNLVTRGSIVSNELYVGVVACQVNTAPVMFENVKNYASITHTTNSKKENGVGGLVGTMGITGNSFISCYNYGNFSTAAGAYAPQVHMGGIVGRTDGAATNPVSTTQFVNCYNEGDLRTTIGYSMFGGILGRASSYEHFKFENCHNKGDITFNTTGNSGRNGGIVGFIQRSGYNLSVIGCSNSGNITATNTVSESQTVIGGIVGDTSSISTFLNCINTGTLKNNATSDNSFMGGIVGYSRNSSANKTYTNCTNEGALYHSGNYTAGIVGYDNGVNLKLLNCRNTATASIEVGKDIAPASQTGGISGYTGKGAVYIECVNSGDITAPGVTGGISGKSLGITKMFACVNEGDISIPADAMDSAYAAGILSNGTANSYSLYSCVNTGNLSNAKAPAAFSILAPALGEAAKFCNTGDTTATVEIEGVQRSIEVSGEETFAVRFVTGITEIEKYVSTGILVYVNEQDSVSVKYAEKSTNTVYKQIVAIGNGQGNLYPTSPVEGKYFTAVAVEGISVSGSYTFIVVPYTVVDEGAPVVYGEACVVNIVDGEIAGIYNLADGPVN